LGTALCAVPKGQSAAERETFIAEIRERGALSPLSTKVRQKWS